MYIASVPATGRADSDAPACTPAGVSATEEEEGVPTAAAAANPSVESVALATAPTADPGGSCSTRARPEPRALRRSNIEAQQAPLVVLLQGGDDSSIERLMSRCDVRGQREKGDLTVFELAVGTAIAND